MTDRACPTCHVRYSQSGEPNCWCEPKEEALKDVRRFLDLEGPFVVHQGGWRSGADASSDTHRPRRG